jgi:enoyl-CoA hydratase
MNTPIHIETRDRVTIITINRPHARNAVDGPTAHALYDAFRAFDADDQADVAILTGAQGAFCAGADLKAVSQGIGANAQSNPMNDAQDAVAPMGCTRLQLSKPVIAAIAGHAVAGGMELALWCDLRVVEESAVFGIYCRRFGVPLIDGGTVRLPRLIGMSRALDLMLTGRAVSAQEAHAMGLANRLVADGQALSAAMELAKSLSAFPQTCMRNDRLSAYAQWGLEYEDAMRQEFAWGKATVASGETTLGATRFKDGMGRHGKF